jgi:hypothetical protein
MHSVTEIGKKIAVYSASAAASGIRDPKAIALYVGARALRETFQNVFLSKHPLVGQALNSIA